MPALKIKVGVGLDANPAAAFASAVSAAKSATAKINAEFANVGKKSQGVYRTAARDAEQSADAQSKAQEKAAKNAERAWAQFFERQRRLRAAAVAEEKAAAAKAGQEIAANAGRYMATGLRTAGRFAMEIARGAGLNVDVGSLVGKVVSNEALSARITGYGYVEGEKGAAGVRQDPKRILAEAHAAANAAAMDTGEALSGLSEFVKRSSDLATGRAILSDMAKFAKATGSDFTDVAKAAGDVAKKMGDVPNKAEAIKSMLGVFGRQGKLGAIDMSDLAAQISTVIGPANKFAAGTQAAMTQLGVALQITKSFGGVKGPAQAATSVANFANYLTSKAGQKSLLAGGLKDTDIFADKGHTKLRGIDDIIIAAMTHTGGDLTKMSKMFTNIRAGAVLQGFGQVYGEAGGGDKGAQAIRDIFKSYGAGLSQKDIQEALGREMGTTQSKVQLLNNKLEEIAENAAAKVLPALEKLAPDLVTFADGIAKLAVFVAENPFKSLGVLVAGSITASIAKAAIGDTIGKALGSAISSLPAGSFGVASAVITIAAATLSIMKYNAEADAAKGDVNRAVDTTADFLKKAQEEAAKGHLSRETADELARRGADIAGLQAAGKGYEEPTGALGTVKHGIVKAVSGITGGQEELARAEGTGAQAKAMDATLQQQAAAIQALAQAIHSGKIKVDVTVNEKSGDPKVDNTNRTGP